MKQTPIYGLPYLDGSEKVHQIIDASQGQAEAVEQALSAANMPPPNVDAQTVSARLNTLEERAGLTDALPLVRANRDNRFNSETTANTYEPLPWETALMVGQGVQHTPGTNVFRFQLRAFVTLTFQVQATANSDVAMRIVSQTGGAIIASRGVMSDSSTQYIAYPLQVAPGDEVSTEVRITTKSTGLNPNNTYFAIVGIRPY